MGDGGFGITRSRLTRGATSTASQTSFVDGLLCFSYSNDASLLLPSTTWTQTYRVTGINGWSVFTNDYEGGYVSITAAENGTHVTVNLSAAGDVVAGAGITAVGAGGVAHVTLDAGDVAQLLTTKGSTHDLSGSLVQSDKPVQVLTGIRCIYEPMNQPACDHVEEAVAPAETLGKRYVVATPTRPTGGPGIHVVRFYGNRDGTTLTYAPSKPGMCPDALNAGQVVECGAVSLDFVVSGTQEFGIASFMVSSSVYDPTLADRRGDPSQTTFASVEQFRPAYLFLAPDDYDVSYAVVMGSANAAPAIDGAPLAGFAAIGDGMGVWRATLGAGKAGAHTLAAAQPVGLQVMGYGANTSYQYPGGLDLVAIAPPPTVH
jgi:hypothetical protein